MPDSQTAIGDSVSIRCAEPGDIEMIIGLVQDVVREKYGHLFHGEPPSPTDGVPWLKSWVAVTNSRVVGVGLADGDYLDDLWLRPQFRGLQIGSALLTKLESQIASDGYASGRLRVIADNEGARRFYARRGWRETRVYPHERWGFEMVDMRKDFGADA